jgi:hypothetical protein
MNDLFQLKTTTQKGNIGEKLVDEMLREKGFCIYKPEELGPHAFDRLAIKNKEILLIAEVKSKARRKYYPDTGIDFRHYQDYLKIMEKHNLEVILFFVDEENQEIYGGKLSHLHKIRSFNVGGREVTYPKIETRSKNKIIYFHIDVMTKYKQLSEDDASQLKALTTKDSKYVA